MPVVQQPLQQGHVGKEWYYDGYPRLNYMRKIRRLEWQSSVHYYTPAAGKARCPLTKIWLHRVARNPYTNDVLLFRKLWTPKHWAKNLYHTEDYFDGYLYANRYQDACYIGIILLHHFILLLRPEDENEIKQLAIQELSKNISGKICHPEGDLLLIHRRVFPKNPRNMPTSLNIGLRYLAKLMTAVNLLPGPHITPPEKFGVSQPSHLRDEQPSSDVLERYSLPGSSKTHRIKFCPGDPNLSSLSKFFKPLFTSKYIFLESEKTRYTVETLQLAFVAFQQLADTAMWSNQYAYALYLIQNMTVIVNYLEILLPVPELRRYYTFTMTFWYYGRVHYHLAREQHPRTRYHEEYNTIFNAYKSWSDVFYSGLEKEVKNNLNDLFHLVDRSEQFMLPRSKEECRLKSYMGYLKVQIPREWKRSVLQHNLVIFYKCHKQLKNWTGSLMSSKIKFSFEEKNGELYLVMKALCSIHFTSLNSMSRVSLALLKAKCLDYLSILDVSQLINWCSSDISKDFPLDAYSFERILCLSESKVSVEDCEVHTAQRSENVPPPLPGADDQRVSPTQDSNGAQLGAGNGQQSSTLTPEDASERSTSETRFTLRHKHFQDYLNSPAYAKNSQSWSEENSKQLATLTETKNEGSTAGITGLTDQTNRSSAQPDGSSAQQSPVGSGLSEDTLRKALVSRKAFEGRTDEVVYQIYNVPVAVSNLLKANEYRLEGSEFMDTRNSIYSNFIKELSISTPSNIMIQYIHLQEYETDPKFLWQMTRDFANLLDKWFPVKINKRRFHTQPLTRVDYPMLNKIFTFMFMGGCLAFYFLYRVQGDRLFYNNARYFYAMMTLHVVEYDLWEPVLNSLAEHVEIRQLVLLDCHDDLRRLPDRCVAVIRSYLHMLPLLYEMCIMKQTKGGPTNCEQLRVKDVAFPFNLEAVLNPDEDTDITLKILRKAKNYLRKRLRFGRNKEIITALEHPTSYNNNNNEEEILEYRKKEKVVISRTVPNYLALERWSWKVPERDTRPMCTGDDDCVSAPCPVEEYIDEEEKNYVDVNIVEEPEFLNELLTLNTKDTTNLFASPNPLNRLRKSLDKVLIKLIACLERRRKCWVKMQYVRVCIPGISVADPSRATPNERREDLTISYFIDGLTRSKSYLVDYSLSGDLALCKALVCLDKLLNQQFRISHFLRGSITDLDDFLHGEEELFESRPTA